MMRSGTTAAVLLGTVFFLGCGSASGPEPDSAALPTADTVENHGAPGAGSDLTGPPGQVTGHAPEAAEGTPSIVILNALAPKDTPIPTEPAEMDQFGREFFPRLLLVRQGQPVVFLNSEDELHTVHVADLDGHSLFNVAMPIRGGRHDHTFQELGEYAVSCDAHNEMAATILVVDTPYATIAERDGTFSFAHVPAGAYDVMLRRGAQRHRQVVEIVPGDNELALAFP